jgi:hypothetical protein
MGVSGPELADRITRLDTTLFDHIEAQIDPEDRRSLLALHSACRSIFGTFSYLEIGSHLGGSLQIFVRDPSCRAIVSIDPRPDSQPDERGIHYEYDGNSTARMLQLLGAIPGADLTKLQTIELSTHEIDPGELPFSPQLAFVDGEHTDRATLGDARFCEAAMHGHGCIVFHDAAVVYRALGEFLSGLENDGRTFHACLLPSSILAVELGDARILTSEPVAELSGEGYKAYLRALEHTEPYRREYRLLTHRVLRRIERGASDAAGRLGRHRHHE